MTSNGKKDGKLQKFWKSLRREVYLTSRSIRRSFNGLVKSINAKFFCLDSPIVRKVSKMRKATTAWFEKTYHSVSLRFAKKPKTASSTPVAVKNVSKPANAEEPTTILADALAPVAVEESIVVDEPVMVATNVSEPVTQDIPVKPEKPSTAPAKTPVTANVANSVKSFISNFSNSIISGFTSAKNNVVNTIVSRFTRAKNKVLNTVNRIVYRYRRTKKAVFDWFWHKYCNIRDAYIFVHTLFLHNRITLKTSFGRNYGVAYHLDPYLEYKYLVEYIHDAAKQGLPHLIIPDEYVYPEILYNLATNGFDIYVFAEGTSIIVSWYDAEKDKKGKVFSPWYYFMPYREMTFTPDSIITATQARAFSFENQYKRVYRYMNSAFLYGESSTLLPFLVYLDIPHQILYKENLFCKVSIDEEHNCSRLTDIHIAIPDEYTDENLDCAPPHIIYDGNSVYEYVRSIEQYNAAQTDPMHMVNLNACKGTIDYARYKQGLQPA